MNTRETALLIIDMQRDFVTAESPLCVAGAAATVPAIAALLKYCRHDGNIAIFHVIREYDPSGIDLERSRLEQFQGGGDRAGTSPASGGDGERQTALQRLLPHQA